MAKVDPQGKPTNPLNRETAQATVGEVERPIRPTYETPKPRPKTYHNRGLRIESEELRRFDDVADRISDKVGIYSLEFSWIARALLRACIDEIEGSIPRVEAPKLKRPPKGDSEMMEQFERELTGYVRSLIRHR
ncbi:MAG: hypothetical protein AAGJ83_11490 [Planctomycetota bacterium]